MTLMKARDALVQHRMISVRPCLNCRNNAPSPVAAGRLNNLE